MLEAPYKRFSLADICIGLGQLSKDTPAERPSWTSEPSLGNLPVVLEERERGGENPPPAPGSPLVVCRRPY